jgi:hypothetical protein
MVLGTSQGIGVREVVDKDPAKNRLGIEIIKKLSHNPNSRIGFQIALISQIDENSTQHCKRKIEWFKNEYGIRGVKAKLNAKEGRFLWTTDGTYEKNQSIFQRLSNKKMKSSVMLIDP